MSHLPTSCKLRAVAEPTNCELVTKRKKDSVDDELHRRCAPRWSEGSHSLANATMRPSVPREMAQPREIMALSWDRGSERASERTSEERSNAQSMVIKIAPTHKKSEIPDLGAVASFSQRIQRNRPAPLQFCGPWVVRSVSNS